MSSEVIGYSDEIITAKSDLQSPQETCPITGLPIFQKASWCNISIKQDFFVTYRMIGHNILHEISHGTSNKIDVGQLVTYQSKILEDFFKDKPSTNAKIVVISDFRNIAGFPSRPSRASFIESFKNTHRLCRGFIAFHVPWKLRAVTRLAFKLTDYAYPLEMQKDFQDAVKRALYLSRHYELLDVFDARNFISPDEWKFAGEHLNIEFKVIKERVFYAHCRGYFKKNEFAKSIQISKRILEQGYFSKKEHYMVNDFSEVKGASWPARLSFIKTFNAFKRPYGIPRAIFIVKSSGISTVAMLLTKKKMGVPMIFVKNLDEALAMMRSMENSQSLPPSKPQAKKIDPLIGEYANEIIDYLGTFSWQKPGVGIPDIPETHPFKSVFDALNLVKLDSLELLQESKKARRDAEKANEAKSQFLANITHELRTPLNGILGMSELLLRDKLSDEQIDTLMDIKYSGQALMDIVNDILDFSKIEAGKIKLIPREFDIHRLVQRLIGMLDLKAREKKLLLHSNLEKEIPQYLRGDPVRLRQILLNLVDNAIKFTHEGSILVNIEKISENGPQIILKFSIIDTGIGIPPAKISFLFKKYASVEASTKREYSGTGLGLPIARDLVGLMGGILEVESIPGKGSCFFFNIPLEKGTGEEKEFLSGLHPSHSKEKTLLPHDHYPGQVKEPSRLENSNGSAEVGEKLQQVTILLAEDNLINRKLVERFLKLKGWQVIHARDGKEVVDKFAAHPGVQMVLMDIRMPGVDGFTAATQIRNWEKENNIKKRTPIIALSAHSADSLEETIKTSGMDGYLSKPINPEEMFRLIEEHIFDIEKR